MGLGLGLTDCRSSKPGGSQSQLDAASRANAERPGVKAPSSATFVVAPAPSARGPTGPEPLTGDGSPLQRLPVEGFGAAIVSVPLGATTPRPVVLALHGNYDRPEWQCEVWREITDGFPWVLCPRGVPRQDAPRNADRWTFADLVGFEKELLAGLEALKHAHAPYVDLERPIFTGFSLGAILGVHLLKKRDSPFERAVLIEGGYRGWGVAGARAFADRGGKKLLIGCGQTACVHAGRQLERLFANQSASVEVVSGGNVGHTYAAEVQEAVATRWAWLVQGDPRYPVPGGAGDP
jgi:predicted esterase